MLFTANHFEIMTRRNAVIMLTAVIPMIFILVIFLLQAKFTPKTTGTGLFIPAPKMQTLSDSDKNESESNLLPVIDDFYDWAFKVKAYPYRNLYDKNWENEMALVKPGYTVSQKTYSMTDNGIVEEDEVLLEYNIDFEKEINSFIKILIIRQLKNSS